MLDQHVAFRTAGEARLHRAAGHADKGQVNIDLIQHFQRILAGQGQVFAVDGTAAHRDRGVVQAAQLQRNGGAGGEDVQADIGQRSGQDQVGGAGIQKDGAVGLDELQCLVGDGGLGRVVLLHAHVKARVAGVADGAGTAPDLDHHALIFQSLQVPVDGHQRNVGAQSLQFLNGGHVILFDIAQNALLTNVVHVITHVKT